MGNRPGFPPLLDIAHSAARMNDADLGSLPLFDVALRDVGKGCMALPE